MTRDTAHRGPMYSHRRGDAAKVIIITVCAFAMIMMLLCIGAGVYGYVLFQRNFGRMVVQNPIEIQKVTTEITDITIPGEFTPIMGSAMFVMKTVTYAWNPTAKPLTLENWQQSQDSMQSVLMLMEMSSDTATRDADFKISSVQKKVLAKQYTEHEHVIREYDIRGRKCEFLFVTGRPIDGAFDDEMLFDEADEEEMMEEEEAAASKPAITETVPEKPVDAAPADAANPVAPTETPVEVEKPVEAAPVETTTPPKADGPPLPAVRTVTGRFPGKSGPVTITVRIPAEGTSPDLLEGIIKSIH